MKKPLLLHYYITNRCNANCKFCNIWQERPKTDANDADVAQNLKSARKAGCKFVDFTGGEPLLHPSLPKFLRSAKKLGFMTSVTTNCLLFEERAEELSGLVDLLHFSIDADTPALHNKIRGCESYNHVIRSIDAAIKNRLYPDLLFTYTDENINAVEGVIKLAREKRLILILDPVFAQWGPDNLNPEIHRLALKYSKTRGVYLNRAHLLLRDRGGNRLLKPLCRAVSSTVVITPDNKLAMPCYHHRAINITINNDLHNVLLSPERRESQSKEGRYSFCHGCHINCYFDPTYQYTKNRYLYESMAGKLKYAITKYLLYRRPWPLLNFSGFKVTRKNHL
ncbi:MAG: radical SAM protein [Chitinispirillia bacterium]|nr:radical SAM protein [Chitinispirillia bacterium]MCL2269445.1 radical SAM protein [Chitinispirillia bacterium]